MVKLLEEVSGSTPVEPRTDLQAKITQKLIETCVIMLDTEIDVPLMTPMYPEEALIYMRKMLIERGDVGGSK